MLKNPTAEFMVQTCLAGERATWPKLSRIRNRCAVELELDAAVQTLRARVVFSPSQVDLRRMTTGSVRGAPRQMGMKRRGSGSHINTQPQNTEDDDSVHNSRTSVSRPPAGLPMRRPISFLVRSATAYPLSFTAIESSAGESTYSARSSDADIDSFSESDASSPEPDDLVMRPRAKVDFFSSSQPVTPGSDHVLATSPLSSRSMISFPRFSLTSSPESKMKMLRPVGGEVKVKAPK